MSDTITIQLKKPIEHDGKQISSLTFREPTVGDNCLAERLGQGQFDQLIVMLSGMSDVPIPVLHKISQREFTAMMEKLAPFLGEDEAAA